MSRIERLLNLTSALLNTERPITAEELRKRIPGYPGDRLSFRRQFERDKEALRQLGLPLTIEPLPGSDNDQDIGYRIRQEEYFLRDPGLAPDELSALHLAAQMVRYGDASSAAGMWKLGVTTDIDLATVETAAELPTSGPLSILFDAIAQRVGIEFGYRGERRSVVPRRLAFRNGHWYLAAFDPGRADERSFRVDRMEPPVLLIDTAEVPPPEVGDRLGSAFDAPWELGDGAPVAASVRIDAPHATWALGRLGERSVLARHDDASISFEMRVRNVDAFRSFVLGFLDHAMIESPEVLRDELVAWVQAGIAVP